MRDCESCLGGTQNGWTGRRLHLGPAGHDGGSASIWVLTAGVLVWVVTVAVLAVAQGMVARHRAGAAADLAALAAADRAYFQPDATDVVCAVASALARANAAELVACTVVGQVVDVTVRVDVAGPIGTVVGPATVRSRAGPGP